ncbi:hypothetical protein [Streptomyces globisporus]
MQQAGGQFARRVLAQTAAFPGGQDGQVPYSVVQPEPAAQSFVWL